MIKSAGIVSYISPFISTVLQSEGSQTSQQGLFPTSPLMMFSIGSLFIQIRFDCNGSCLNSEIFNSSFSSVTSIPRGARAYLSLSIALSISCSVFPHLGHVSPFVTSLCHFDIQ